MTLLEQIILDFIETAEYHNNLPQRIFPEDDDFEEMLYERKETIKNK